MSTVNHILDCIYQYHKDLGEDPREIRMTSGAIRELTDNILRSHENPETPGIKLLYLEGLDWNKSPQTFAGIPIVPIYRTTQEGLKF